MHPQGGVYAYRRIGSNWTFEQKFFPSTATIFDKVGSNLVVQGDPDGLDDAIVDACRDAEVPA